MYGSRSRLGPAPHWYYTIKAAERLQCPPWQLVIEQVPPFVWRQRALAAMECEAEAKEWLDKKAKRDAKRNRGRRRQPIA